ncbi:MAG: single-stranded DNA-binding protein [Parachlamydiaceae bacterium]|nr:single-stranded DNA-binding protein [Parachlamydiaceae bacterium]
MIIVQIAGRLGRDPETRFTPSGLKVTNLTIATSVRKGGKEETVWWRVTIWGERFDKMISFLKKGSAVIAIGEMTKPEIWTDKEGRPQVNLELTADIIRFSPFGNPDSSKQEQTGTQTSQAQSNFGNEGGYNDAGGNGNGNVSSYGSPSSSGNSQYGTAQGASTARFNQSIPHNEENLPF